MFWSTSHVSDLYHSTREVFAVNSIIETRDLSISFGGHTAVDSVSISVSKNHFKSIIGPNGAGKTTFFNLLSGQLKPTKGQILFNGEDITNLSPTKRTRKGIGRSFQITNVFPNLTVLRKCETRCSITSGYSLSNAVSLPKI